jgi:Kelch motif
MPRGLAAITTLAVLAVACSDPPAPIGSTEGLSWQSLAPVPTERTEVAAALLDGRIYVAGGFAAPNRTVDTVEVYDIAADEWTAGPPLPLPVNHAMAAATEAEIFLFGGFTGEGPPSDRAFVLRGEAWEELPRMPEPRGAGGAAVAGGLLYVVGGVGPDGVAEQTMVFDLETGRWSFAAGLDRPREHLGVAVAGDTVYAVGGRAGTLSGFGDLESYDPGADRWTPLGGMPTPRGGMAAAGTSNGFVVAVGGEEESGTFDEAEAYDVEGERWIALPPLSTARHGLGVVADGTTVYVIAGGPEPGLAFSGAVESIDLAPLR